MINEVNEFIRLANINNQQKYQIKKLLTQNNKAIIGDLQITVSFGAGNVSKVPWFSVTRYTGYKEDGPVFLYYKEKQVLILSFGIKEEQTTWNKQKIDKDYDFRWDDTIRFNYDTIESYFGEKVPRYNDSYLFKSYKVEGDSLSDTATLEDDIVKILELYKNQLKVHNMKKNTNLIDFIKSNYNDYKSKYEQQINNERSEFLSFFPLNKLVDMTLDQYSQTGNKESFTNFIENKTSSICSGSLGINQNKLFFPKGSNYEVLGPVDRWYYNFTTIEGKFEQYKKELFQLVTRFDINHYQEQNVLKFRSNILKFKSLRLYRPDIKLFGLPSHHETKKILSLLSLDFDKKNDDSIVQNIVLTNYLIENYPNILSLNTDIINRLIWDYKTKYIDSSETVEDESSDTSSNGDIDMKKIVEKNIILYGPPGTGKTYNAIKYAVAICESKDIDMVMKEPYSDVLKRYNEYVSMGRIMFTTFHQSYGYEEFIEGLYPEIDKISKQLIYKIKNGVFKKFCIGTNAGTDFEMAWNNFINDVNNRKIKWGEVFLTAEDQTKHRLLTLNSSENIIVPYGNGVPFTKENALKFYNGEEIDNTQKQVLKYMFDYYKKHYFKEKQPKVFIIDEINRGNISKIFGELITLIEDTKRSGEAEEISAILPYSKKAFTVPNNVYLLGTMNTADRSISIIDTALRRRFRFIEMMPKSDEIPDKEFAGVNIRRLLNAMNERIEILYDREHTIGHAYFMGLSDSSSLSDIALIFRNQIFPLLQEYFYEDYSKIRLVLGDNAKPETFQFVNEVKNDTKKLFKGNVSPDNISDYRYQINERAFFEVESYQQIY